MSSTNLIVKHLPKTFTRADVFEIAKELDYSFATANSFIAKAIYQGLIDRTAKGEYKKTG